MYLDPLYIQVLPRLANTGSTLELQGVLPIKSIDIGFRHFDVPGGINYDVNLFNTSEAVLLSGTAAASLSTNCDRCLEHTELSLAGEVQGYYLFDPSHTPGEEQLESYESVDREGHIDIAPPILAAIVYELPTVTLCKPDCEGILLRLVQSPDPAEAVEEGIEGEDGIDPESPFAALKDYRFEE